MKTAISVWLLLLGIFIPLHLPAQIRSVTLGLQTHCPYGIKGCWPEIRDGLESPTEIRSISRGPDSQTSTCEVLMREDWLPDPDFFAQNFTNVHIGVDVRGVELMVDGSVEMAGTNLVLRVGGQDTVMELAPLTHKVQWDRERKQPEPMSALERDAFRTLSVDSTARRTLVRITGPLLKKAPGNGCKLVLQVRKFEVLERK
jgi:hypothetical protein